MADVKITFTGPIASGKSQLLYIIRGHLKKRGLHVFVDAEDEHALVVIDPISFLFGKGVM